MTKIKFKLKNDTETIIDAENGLSLMEIARDNDLGIEGTCGGSISCCTCHVILDSDWIYQEGPETDSVKHDVYYNQWEDLDDSPVGWHITEPTDPAAADGWLLLL